MGHVQKIWKFWHGNFEGGVGKICLPSFSTPRGITGILLRISRCNCDACNKQKFKSLTWFVKIFKTTDCRNGDRGLYTNILDDYWVRPYYVLRSQMITNAVCACDHSSRVWYRWLLRWNTSPGYRRLAALFADNRVMAATYNRETMSDCKRLRSRSSCWSRSLTIRSSQELRHSGCSVLDLALMPTSKK